MLGRLVAMLRKSKTCCMPTMCAAACVMPIMPYVHVHRASEHVHRVNSGSRIRAGRARLSVDFGLSVRRRIQHGEIEGPKNTATKHFRVKNRWALLSVYIPCPLLPPRRCVVRSQCDRCCLRFMPVLMDRAARSPFHQKKKGLPCGAALAHWPLLDSNRVGAHTTMCAGGVLVLLSIFLLLLLLTSAPEGVEMFMRLGGCVSFWLPMNRLYSSGDFSSAVSRRVLLCWTLVAS